jgi:TonB-linked SusC/RagA family outer membrane protein
MKNHSKFDWERLLFPGNKLLLVMRLSTLLLMFNLLSVNASVFSQSFTLKEDNIPLKDLLFTLESQSKITFLYRDEIVENQYVSVDLKNADLGEVLNQVLQKTGDTYRQLDNLIIIIPKEVVQQQKVTGTVTDATTNEPIIGASVIIEGTPGGAVTDLNGKFTLDIPKADAVIVVSFLGYNSERVTVNEQSVLNIKLLPDIQKLNDVVVIGYGTQKKETVTGAISNVTSKGINTTSNINVVNMLAGKLPGLRVTQRTGEPGDYATDFDIRGFGTPLTIVDGVPRDFNKLDPNEIESVTVLKDASAAVYGVKGGNGVILVTTKKGSKGKTEFSYTGTYGVTQIANSPSLLNAYEYATLTDESYINANNTPPYSKEQLEQYRNGTLPSTDWFDLVVRKNAPQQQHNLSVSGSSEKVKYFLSLGYYDESGIYKSGDLNTNRYNFRSNVTADVTKNLQAEIFVNGIIDTKNSPSESTGGIFQALWSIKPTISIYANDNPAYLSDMEDAVHPLAITNSSISGYNKNTNKTFNGSFALNYTPAFIQGLKARILYAYDNAYNFNKIWKKQFDLYTYDAATKTYSVTGSRNSPTTLTQNFGESTATTAQASLEYEKTFLNVHNIKALLLVEERKSSGLSFNGSKQFSFDAVDQLYAGNALNQAVNSGNINPNVNQGLVGRLNYGFKGKYFAEGSFRYDGSSKFADGHRWGFFPAISAGWRISEESFLKDKIAFLNSLKVRASYGKLGDDGSSSYQYLSGYNYPSSNYVFNGTLVNGLGFRGLSNYDLTWYTSKLTNIGLDADVWQNNLHIEADFFNKKREGLLATRNLSLPSTVGAGLPQENLNSDLTRGFELTLTHRKRIGEVEYNVSGNVSFTRTKNLYIERASSNNSYRNWRDNNSYRWNDNYFGLKVLGQFQSMEEIKNSPIEDGNGNRNLLPGDLKYEDLNHDGIIDDNDYQNVGRNSGTPEINFGLTLGAQWKGFDVNILFQGASNFTVSYIHTIALDAPLAWGRNGLDVFMDRWHKADMFDPNSAWVAGKYPSTRTKSGLTTSADWNYQPSDFWLKDASYLRLKSVQIGYTFPASMLGNDKFIKSLRVYVNGFNLATWSGLNSLIDPEHTNTTYGNTYPITKNYNFGINLIF